MGDVLESAEREGATAFRGAKSVVRFAGLVLDLDACTLARVAGETIALTRGELALLRVFVSRPGRVLSRDALLDAIASRPFKPFDRSVDMLVGRLRRKIEPDPKEPRLIVTVPGEGYRFDRLARAQSSAPTIGEPAAGAASPLANVLYGLITPAPDAEDQGAVNAAQLQPLIDEPPRLSIVVLPFANISGDASQDYFVDGMTESLTTDLSRIFGAFVIGRSTAFTYKGRAVDHRTIGRDLNVRYILEGSVQRAGGRLRVNAQLLEAETGKHLWAERFDKALADLFDMQDEIVARLANQLRAELTDAEARRAERSLSPDSVDLCFQGRALLDRARGPEMLAKARVFYERALELDPGNVDALVGGAAVDLIVGTSYMTGDPRPLMAAAETKLSKALAAAPNLAPAHGLMGLLCCATNRTLRSVEELERALAIDPNLAEARGTMGLACLWSGRAEETEAHVLEALRLSPRDRTISDWLLHAGAAKAYLGEHEQAVAWLRKSIDANRNCSTPFFYLAACLAHRGRLEEARQEVEAGLAVDPNFTIARFRAGVRSTNALLLSQRDRVIEGMRLAGVPEG